MKLLSKERKDFLNQMISNIDPVTGRYSIDARNVGYSLVILQRGQKINAGPLNNCHVYRIASFKKSTQPDIVIEIIQYANEFIPKSVKYADNKYKNSIDDLTGKFNKVTQERICYICERYLDNVHQTSEALSF